jgi:squalene cyclase
MIQRSALLCLVILFTIFPGLSQQKNKVHQEGCPSECKLCQDTIQKGLDYLVKRQSKRGAWYGNWGTPSIDLTLTSLSGLALLSDGSTHKQGRYKGRIAKALRFILKEGAKTRGRTHMNCQRPFVLLFLSQIYRIDPDRKIEKVAQKIIKRLKRNQYKDGGWCYNEKARSSRTGNGHDYTLLAMTHSILTSLVTAKNAGLKVPGKLIEKATRFCERCARKGGSFGYSLGGGGSSIIIKRTEPSRTGAALCALILAKPGSKKIDPATRYFKKHMKKAIRNPAEYWYWYNMLFSAFAMYLHPQEGLWDKFDKLARQKLVRLQRKKGFWRFLEFKEFRGSNKNLEIFSTSIALIVLQLYKGRLVFSKKKKTPEDAVKGAIEYLKRSQNRSGGWEGNWGSASVDITLTSLAGLAFLATGSTHKDGPHKGQIKGALKYILKQVRNPARRFMRSHLNFQLAFALLFLAEIYRIDPDDKIEKVATKIVKRFKR